MGWDHVKVLEDRINTLEEKVSNITVKLEAPSSIIKSIQRGTGSGNATITINEVNPDKAIVILNGGNVIGGAGYFNYTGGCPLASLTSDKLTISNARYNYSTNDGSYVLSVSYSWQVIEFW